MTNRGPVRRPGHVEKKCVILCSWKKLRKIPLPFWRIISVITIQIKDPASPSAMNESLKYTATRSFPNRSFARTILFNRSVYSNGLKV